MYPEQSDAQTDSDVVQGVEAHHAHQQILQDDPGVTGCRLEREGSMALDESDSTTPTAVVQQHEGR